MKFLKEYLSCIESGSKPIYWTIQSPQIESEHRHLKKILLRREEKVYGSNTLPGHRDDENIPPEKIIELDKELLDSHAIGLAPFYRPMTTRYISYAKVYSWAAGGSGVSLELYNSLIKICLDEAFTPKIPIGSTYSCGDVIPAAHWAKEAISRISKSHNLDLHPGEAMAMINGSFIHVGYAGSIVNKIKNSWYLFIELSVLSKLANKTGLYNPCVSTSSYVKASVAYVCNSPSRYNTSQVPQKSVSVRAIPQVVETLAIAVEDYLVELDLCLSKPSSNPLVNEKHHYAMSQASFLAATLSIKTSALIDSILFAMWSIVGRCNYLLSGQVKEIPKDGSSKCADLALIQYPKIMTAILEKSRMNFGNRAFVTGSQTSYGIEDLSTHGVILVEQLENLLSDFIKLCTYETFIYIYLLKELHIEDLSKNKFIKNFENVSDIEELKSSIENYFNNKKEIRNLFPI